MNRPDPYAAMRQEQDAQAPYLLTPTHKAIMALWRALRYTVESERVCLRAYRQTDGRPVGYLAQLSETDGQRLLAHLQDKWDADQALSAKEATNE
jgi:hypothetical protein